MLRETFQTCLGLERPLLPLMYTHLVLKTLDTSQNKTVTGMGVGHTRVVHKRANQRPENNHSKREICRNGICASCGVSRCLVPQYNCWYVLNVCNFCSSFMYFKVPNLIVCRYHAVHSQQYRWQQIHIFWHNFVLWWVTMSMAANLWFFFSSIAWYYCNNDFIIQSFDFTAWLAVPDTDSHATCSKRGKKVSFACSSKASPLTSIHSHKVRHDNGQSWLAESMLGIRQK